VELEIFELAVLRRPEHATAYDEETLQRIQREHIAYHTALRAAGDVVTNGPVLDQPDVSLRGFTVYRTGSLERARELASNDPAVKAGRLAVDLMRWCVPPATMIRKGELRHED
jgi:uncharacterized protein